jgi:hypothetical protein
MTEHSQRISLFIIRHGIFLSFLYISSILILRVINEAG